MGYQNKSRPKSPKDLVIDVLFDLDDLRNDLNTGVKKAQLLESIEFIRGTVKRLAMKMRETKIKVIKKKK
jgi:hypothetical protein